MKIYWLLGLFLFSAVPSFAADSWRLCSRLENGTEFSMTQYKMTMSLKPDSVSGSGGCNHYTGKVSKAPGLLFETIMSTQMACLKEDGQYDFDLMEAEETFLSIMATANRMTRSDGGIQIFNGEGDELRFAPEGSCK